MLSIEKLRELLSYDPEIGTLVWKFRYPLEENTSFNSQWAGREAFTSMNSLGYVQGEILGKNYKGHRVAFAIHYGYWPDEVDHEDGIKTHNWISNLRDASRYSNAKNMPISKRNSSGVVGVRKVGKKFQATICANGIRLTLGTFSEFEDAVSARKEAELKYGFHPNHGRK